MSQADPKLETISEKVRAAYDREPYPPGRPDPAQSHLPSIPWMLSAARPGEKMSDIRRVLVAGCGSGLEAFVFAKAMPDAQVEAVDFSPRSIEVAKEHQKELALANVNFQVADLTSPDVLKMFDGQPFDLITCHGVISTVADTQALMNNLSALLGPKGFLYLGFDDSSHVSLVARPFLTWLGYDLENFEDTPVLRGTLELFDRIHGTVLHKASPGYLANDLFGSLIKVFSASEILEITKAAGLKLRTGSLFQSAVLALAGADLKPLVALEPSQVSEFFYRSTIFNGFSRLILLKGDLPRPPFDDIKKLLKWRPLADTVKFRNASDQPPPPYETILTVKANTTRVSPDVEFQLSYYIFEFCTKANGESSVAEILASIPHEGPDMGDLVNTLFLFYHSSVLNLLPPKTSWVTA